MNKHSARIRSKNDLRRARNKRENEGIIPAVIQRVIDSTNRQASNLQNRVEYPIDFYYPLSVAVTRVQKLLGIPPYRLRDSKIQEIIALLEGYYSGQLLAPVADRYTDERGNVELQMFRA